MRRAVALTFALLAGTACRATVSDRGVQGVPGEEIWKTEVELRLGEVAYVDARDLEIQLEAVGVTDATILIRGEGAPRRERLVVGPAATVSLPPYDITLLSTGIDGSAVFEVRREYGP